MLPEAGHSLIMVDWGGEVGGWWNSSVLKTHRFHLDLPSWINPHTLQLPTLLDVG